MSLVPESLVPKTSLLHRDFQAAVHRHHLFLVFIEAIPVTSFVTMFQSDLSQPSGWQLSASHLCKTLSSSTVRLISRQSRQDSGRGCHWVLEPSDAGSHSFLSSPTLQKQFRPGQDLAPASYHPSAHTPNCIMMGLFFLPWEYNSRSQCQVSVLLIRHLHQPKHSWSA